MQSVHCIQSDLRRRGGTAFNYCGVMQGLPMETYMMAFTYGSVVIFNASDAMTKRLLRMCRKYSKQVVQDEFVEGAPRHAAA